MLAALVALGKHLGMFAQRTQSTNAHYAISDQPMTEEEWEKRYVTPHESRAGLRPPHGRSRTRADDVRGLAREAGRFGVSCKRVAT
jgi:hypothetical protein